MNKSIVIAVGSTGGHFFPGLRIARSLKEKYGIRSAFLGPVKTGFQVILNKEKIIFFDLKIASSRKNIILYYLSLLKTTLESFLFLSRRRPALVIGTGSFGSFPACMSAYLLGIPVFLHEQNVIFGKANRFLAKFAKKIFFAFPISSLPKKGIIVGNPVEKCKLDLDKQTCYEKFGLDASKKTLLIFGGSQGAFSLNTWVMKMLEEIEDFKNWQIIHITGEADCKRVKRKYANFEIHAAILPFLFPMDYAYMISDLAIARGGALSLSELSFWAIPSLIMSYSYAKDNHQEYNALYFQEKGGVTLLKKTDIKTGHIPAVLRELLSDSDKLAKMSKKMKKILPGGALEKICGEIKKEIDRNTVEI